MKITIIVLVTSLIAFISIKSQASDHVDGPITINHPVADISDLYAFPSPDKPGRLVLILNSYPFVPGSGHFSDRLVYSLLVKPVTKMGTGLKSGFQVGKSLYRFDCTFETPHEANNHRINCSTPGGHSVQGAVDKVISSNEHGIRLYAGKRSDTFLFNSSWFGDVVFNRIIPAADSTNDISRLNILSIIMEVDLSRVFEPQESQLFAIAGEISHRNPKNNVAKIIDRVGRPEISNARMVATTQQDDLRDRYNQEQSFNVIDSNRVLYKQRIMENIDYFDKLDGHTDWLPKWKHVLASLLVNDYLVIDMTKPFSSQGYFDIENSMLRGQAHTRSGGRVPGDHIINILISTMINGGHAQAISDGIPINIGIPSAIFPYLAPPNTGLIALIKGYLARKGAKSLSLQKRAEPVP